MSLTLHRRMGSVLVRYRPAGTDGVETTLDRVSVQELAAAGPVREFRWFKGSYVLLRLVLVVHDGRVGRVREPAGVGPDSVGGL